MTNNADRRGGEEEETRAEWRKEQFRVAKQVVVLQDDGDSNKNIPFKEADNTIRYKILPSDTSYCDKLFGGVDVSFPETEGDLAVAVYCIVCQDKVVYQDTELFTLKIPYVSSYLSFREIDPLERLVKKQMREKPEMTPYAILVDGNGVLHERQAGIACFLGVRTGLKTIGVGKTLYCQRGLSTTLVKNGIHRALAELVRRTSEDLEFKDRLQEQRSVIIDQHCISAEVSESKNERAKDDDSLKNDGKIFQELSMLCKGIGIQLKGDNGTILASALVGHGGQIGNRSRDNNRGTKNPIFVSVGHLVSLEEAVHICAVLSKARIPEPVRHADMSGRTLLRDAAQNNK